jgi:GTP-binding protein HflX
MAQKSYPTTAAQSHVILVGVTLAGHTPSSTQNHLQELAALADTRGLLPVATFTQRLERPNRKTFIGSGKVAEIKACIQEKAADGVLFDEELAPSQLRNLEEQLQCPVWDRSLLILEIFALHARTRQAKTQVELAQYQYLYPRLKQLWSHLSRQKGGMQVKGPGEKQLETDRRIIQKKISALKDKLKHIASQTAVQRKNRNRGLQVALVGYTNAGKSTLMQCLSHADVYCADQLFATLSTTVRKIVVKQQPLFLADTVGFIHKLPHTLIECFKSTLAAVREADILLHVVDYSHSNYQEQMATVKQTLIEIGVAHIPTLLVLNKIDQAEALQEETKGNSPKACAQIYQNLATRYTLNYNMPVVLISSLHNHNLPALKEALATCALDLLQVQQHRDASLPRQEL